MPPCCSCLVCVTSPVDWPPRDGCLRLPIPVQSAHRPMNAWLLELQPTRLVVYLPTHLRGGCVAVQPHELQGARQSEQWYFRTARGLERVSQILQTPIVVVGATGTPRLWVQSPCVAMLPPPRKRARFLASVAATTTPWRTSPLRAYDLASLGGTAEARDLAQTFPPGEWTGEVVLELVRLGAHVPLYEVAEMRERPYKAFRCSFVRPDGQAIHGVWVKACLLHCFYTLTS